MDVPDPLCDEEADAAAAFAAAAFSLSPSPSVPIPELMAPLLLLRPFPLVYPEEESPTQALLLRLHKEGLIKCTCSFFPSKP